MSGSDATAGAPDPGAQGPGGGSTTPVEPPAPAHPPVPRSTRAARWIDVASGAVLLATTLVTVVAVTPSLLGLAGLPILRSAGRRPTPASDVRHQPPEILSDPDKLLEADRDDPEDVPFAPTRGHAQLGQARGAVALRDRPGEEGRAIGQIRAGELVMILKESGDWLQVWASSADGVLMGWVKKSGIAVR
jgi:hypothetical protein